MREPTQQELSRHFSNLIGRRVVFEKTLSNVESKQKKLFAVYKSFPSEATIVVMADLCVLGSLAGALVGLPDSEVQTRLAQPVLDDLMSDAISEIFNVATAAIATEGRAAFVEMVMDRTGVKDAAAQVLAKPQRQFSFNVTVESYQGGKVQILE
ncbi:MAG: hypothetical protein ABSF23_12790 [Terracidiphilus sp.]|jgi:hypothetical protein